MALIKLLKLDLKKYVNRLVHRQVLYQINHQSTENDGRQRDRDQSMAFCSIGLQLFILKLRKISFSLADLSSIVSYIYVQFDQGTAACAMGPWYDVGRNLLYFEPNSTLIPATLSASRNQILRLERMFRYSFEITIT